jgi:hypothetical protein
MALSVNVSVMVEVWEKISGESVGTTPVALRSGWLRIEDVRKGLWLCQSVESQSGMHWLGECVWYNTCEKGFITHK